MQAKGGSVCVRGKECVCLGGVCLGVGGRVRGVV